MLLSSVLRSPLLASLLPMATRSPPTAMLFGKSAPSAAVVLNGDSAPSWETLKASARKTATGSHLADEEALRAEGRGGTHTDAKVRLFDEKSEDDVRVVLYRDDAAWCPYCQKVRGSQPSTCLLLPSTPF